MNTILMISASVNFVILLLISAVHVYWSFGGRWGLLAALPEHSGKKAFLPGRIATFAVAIVFGCMAFFYLIKLGWFAVINSWVPDWLNRYGLWLLTGIFFLRAVGEFRYVGFFKRVHNSRFADLDTRFYSPLCLLLSANTVLLIYSLYNL